MSDLAALLSEGPWLTRLARSLASDAAEAADAVQETWLAAMRSPPDPDRPVRPWLRRVLVNTLRMRHRSRGRRAANEAVTESLVEPAQAPDQLLERARLERRLADLVLALDEPFRTTVLLRYREGISAETIAKQQGIPAGTVRSRLKTALDRLRRELDGESPARWRAVFAPLVAVPHPSSGSLWSFASPPQTGSERACSIREPRARRRSPGRAASSSSRASRSAPTISEPTDCRRAPRGLHARR